MPSRIGNPYHDEIGRFTDGPSAGGISAIALKNVRRAQGGVAALRDMDPSKRTALIRREVDKLQSGKGSNFSDGPSQAKTTAGDSWAVKAEKEARSEFGKESWSKISDANKAKVIAHKIRELKRDHGLQTRETGSVAQGSLLSPAQFDSVSEYAGQGYRKINSMLRGDGSLDPKTKAHIANIDAAIARNVIGKGKFYNQSVAAGRDPILYRGTKASAFNVELDDIKPGRVLQNHGFVSTTRSKSMAADFLDNTRGAEKNKFVMHITTTRKSRGVSVRGDAAASGNEREVILARKSKFKVTRVEHKVNSWGDKRIVVHVDHIDPH